MGARTTRRTFLKQAAVGTAAVLGTTWFVPATAWGSVERPAPSSRIALGCIGVGNMGTADMQALMALPEVQVVAVCDVDADHRTKARSAVESHYAQRTASGTFSGCDAYNDFRDLLARDDIDAVLIATPDHWHAPIAIAAARAGKDIYCEKPVSLTVAEGRAVADAVARYGRVFQAGSQQRSAREFRHACELVRNGRIGRLHTIEVGLGPGIEAGPGEHPPMAVPEGFDYDRWLGPAPLAPYTAGRCHGSFRFIFDYAGGKVTDIGAHHLDIGQWANGTDRTGPVAMEGVGRFPAEGLYDTAVSYRFVCEYANGVQMKCWDAFAGGIRLLGTEGSIYVNRNRLDAEPASLLTSVIGPDEVHLYDSGDHYRNFIDCIRTRQETAAPVEVGHRSASVCHLGNIAMRLERRIRWDPDAERFVDDVEASRLLSRPMRSPWHL